MVESERIVRKFRLVLGTHNQKKLRELKLLLEPLGFELKGLADFENPLVVEENGDSFSSNALLKSTQQARHLGEWVLGEDSGLCVPALGDAPGIYSARFAGANATDEDNNRLLLERMAGIPLGNRTAFYVCHLSLSDPNGKEHISCFGRCFGRIIQTRKGSGGFGYDPMFELTEYHQTFGELGDAVKSVLSHRARATREFVPRLLELVSQQ